MIASNEPIDSLLGDYQKMVDRALAAAMDEHLGHPNHEPVTGTRNDKSRKRHKEGESGALPIEVPHDSLLRKMNGADGAKPIRLISMPLYGVRGNI